MSAFVKMKTKVADIYSIVAAAEELNLSYETKYDDKVVVSLKDGSYGKMTFNKNSDDLYEAEYDNMYENEANRVMQLTAVNEVKSLIAENTDFVLENESTIEAVQNSEEYVLVFTRGQ